MTDPMIQMSIDDHIRAALSEDLPFGDVSTQAVMPDPRDGHVDLIAKQDGVIAGLSVFARVFELLDPLTVTITHASDGDEVSRGELVAEVEGDVRVLLEGERTALNYLQRMSGIATYTHRVAALLADSGTTLVCTRKTTPGMRVFEREAVRLGGGSLHRFGLSDGVMLKDNHVAAAGGVTQAVRAARESAPFVDKIEVECETLEQVREAVDAGADSIMRDNMDQATMVEAGALIGGRAQTEASGNVTAENAASYADLGVDFLSCGALTHSAGILDLSLKHLEVID